MKSSTKRLITVLVSSAVALAIAWPLYLRLRPSGPSELIERHRQGSTPSGAGSRAADVPAQPDAHLPGVLELDRPLYPPSTFQRRALSSAEIHEIFPFNSYIHEDPFAYYVNAPGVSEPFEWLEHPRGTLTWRTNSLGLREDEEVRAEPPDLRILVLGDSHTAGLCDNHESWPSLLEARLARRAPGRSIEALNSAKSGYSFYNYLGMLERMLPLEPDAVVVAIYAGNDFEEGLSLYHLFNGTQRPPGSELYQAELQAAESICNPCLSQSFQALKYFAVQPAEREAALQMARDSCTEIAVTCLRRSVPLTFVLIPPPTDVEWELHADVMGRMQAALGISSDDLGVFDRMSDSLLDFLRLQGLEVIDMRPVFQAASEQLFWKKDNHMNLRAQELVAEALEGCFDQLLERSQRRARRDPGSTLHARPDAADALFSPGAPSREDRPRSPLYREP